MKELYPAFSWDGKEGMSYTFEPRFNSLMNILIHVGVASLIRASYSLPSRPRLIIRLERSSGSLPIKWPSSVTAATLCAWGESLILSPVSSEAITESLPKWIRVAVLVLPGSSKKAIAGFVSPFGTPFFGRPLFLFFIFASFSTAFWAIVL